MLVPAYSYPSSGSSSPYWEALYTAVPALKYLVADINSGTLSSPANTDYVSAISAAEAVPGITVVGYVDTEHTSTSISTLEANIDLYFSLYGVTSIFFDNASTDTGSLSYYTTLCNYVHSAHAGAITVLNHGVTPNQGYAAIADVMIVFEGPSYPDGTGIGDWQGALAGTDPGVPQLPASWFSSYPPGRFCAIVYETTPSAGLAGGTPEAWQAVLGQAQAAGIGVVYLTDATYASNPYDVLPTYWTDEVAAVDATAAAAVSPAVVTGKAVLTG
ncbi:MAG TPA: spherulation-specific family 4 protein, partial [Acidimicrobiales bacterium]